ncbi:M24 family metallopeptidase [Alkalibacterium sp. f15]|uniref:M24 family metallopeptidase n=1 Tax=Alkalibacterium sp. f15 TaxID=3414029 RepID=UPI003BF7DB05
MNYDYEKSIYTAVQAPKPEEDLKNISLTDATMRERYDKVLAQMKKRNISTLVIYEDLEHGSNFEYLTGFLTRFEEGVLILHDDGTVFYLLGNENLKLKDKARLKGDLVHVPHFSLPDQPMEPASSFSDVFTENLIKQDKQVGIVGWKLFTGVKDPNSQLFDVPHYIVERLIAIAGKSKLVNATDLFIGREGARTTNNANEVAHYEFGAALASSRMLNTLDAVALGQTEWELGGLLNAYGQPNSVVTIAATGQRFDQANLYPSGKEIQLGDKLSLTVGYKGGLQSRGPIAVHEASELPEEHRDYLDKVAKPYFTAVVAWLEQVHIGMEGKDVYALIGSVLPKDVYDWKLNPGHLTADEEWVASPISKESETSLKSGMLFQVDIIPSVKGYPGVSAEGGVVLADEELKNEIRATYPEVWQRMETRKAYVRDILGINTHEDILFSGNATPYLRPFALNKEKAMVWRNS